MTSRSVQQLMWSELRFQTQGHVLPSWTEWIPVEPKLGITSILADQRPQRVSSPHTHRPTHTQPPPPPPPTPRTHTHTLTHQPPAMPMQRSMGGGGLSKLKGTAPQHHIGEARASPVGDSSSATWITRHAALGRTHTGRDCLLRLASGARRGHTRVRGIYAPPPGRAMWRAPCKLPATPHMHARLSQHILQPAGVLTAALHAATP